jgi:hypothetical protein
MISVGRRIAVIFIGLQDLQCLLGLQFENIEDRREGNVNNDADS